MKIRFLLLMCCLLWVNSVILIGQKDLMINFQQPPNEAKPRVWWHWMNGNITKAGIQKDLEWMKRVGIGGFQNFDANLFTPVVVPQKLVYMTPDWKEAFRFATEQAIQLDLEMAIAGSPGWSVTGGPWVEPHDGMKKYVWTETHVQGGQLFTGKIASRGGVSGHFQDIPISSSALQASSTEQYYQDVAIIAIRRPDHERNLITLSPKITSSGGQFTLTDLTDHDLTKTLHLPAQAVGQDMWIQYEFATPQTIKAISVVGASHLPMEEFNGGPLNRSFQVSDDGVTFHLVARLPGSVVPQNTINFAPATGRFFRLTFTTLPPQVNPFAAMFGGSADPGPALGVDVAEFVLHHADRIDQYEDKAGFTPWKEGTSSYQASSTDAIDPRDVVDLSNYLQEDSLLVWQVPAGRWTILRFGYSLTGRQNHPASPEATGLEVDKLDDQAVRRYINNYLDQYRDATMGQMGPQGLRYMVLDSYEAGHMTWTARFPEFFAQKRGYAILPWLPVLTGRLVGSREQSEQFLWDFRKTIGELIAEHHYDVIGEELHKRGMKRYTESHENKRIYLADGMDVKRYADVPMAAIWTPGSLAAGTDEEPRSEADIRESASVAHIYGQNIVAAESMTAAREPFAFDPARLKRTADLELASGLNRFVIHTSVHQPLDDKRPGFSLGPFGQWFTRQETWADMAKPWMDYLGRSSFMLQQGRFVADILYYYGENTNITSICEQKLPDLPSGYAFDFINSSALIDKISAAQGSLMTASGMNYQVLVLDSSARTMTVPVLRKIKTLAEAGVSITGIRPERTPSRSDDQAEFQRLVGEIWGGGFKTVSMGVPFQAVLHNRGIKEDVVIKAKSKILFVHRHADNEEIYWLDSRSPESQTAEVSFRTAGLEPELWHPQTGKTEKVAYKVIQGRTVIPLTFGPWEAYFIVFKNKTTRKNYRLPELKEKQAIPVAGPWTVEFQPDRGAPASVEFPHLMSWTEHAEPGIKYFSGEATYKQTFQWSQVTLKGQYELDLGEVKNLAEVKLNGHVVGHLWTPPYKLRLPADLLRNGKNDLEIKVVNLWVNRLIGDAQPETAQKITFTTMPFYRANSPLIPAGLLGPVTLKEKL